jgi:hypothetical protein
MTEQDLNPERVRALIADAWGRLHPQDRADRIAYDVAHDIGGVTTHTDGDLIEFVRGGRTLALVNHDQLTGDGPLDLSGREFVPDDGDMV